MTNQPLSPAAQAVLDAAFPAYDDESLCITSGEQHTGMIAAAALRAAANYLTDASSSHTLYAIADEIEGITYGTYRCNLEAR